LFWCEELGNGRPGATMERERIKKNVEGERRETGD